MKKLNDFGEKIGGAKKDLWALFNSLSNEEQGEMAQKTKLWKRPDYRAMVQEGTPKEVFSHREELSSVGLDLPPITQLTEALRDCGMKIEETILSIDEAADQIAGYLNDKGNIRC